MFKSGGKGGYLLQGKWVVFLIRAVYGGFALL